MLPKSWTAAPLEEVVTVGSGLVDPMCLPYSSMLHIGAEDIESGTGRILNPRTCAELGLISGKYEFDEDAVVYSKIRPNLNKVCHPGFRGLCSADAYPLWPDRSVLLPEYLKNYMLSDSFVQRAVARSMRTGMPKINREDLLSLSIAIPPLAEQQRITSILSTWDTAIAAGERLLQACVSEVKALIGKVLMPTPDANRLRVNGDAYPPSVQPGLPKLSPTPESWRRTILARHLCEAVRPVSLDAHCTYRLVTVRRSRGGVDERGVLLGSKIKTPTQFYVKAGDFLISKRQIVHGACGLVPEKLDGAIVSNEYAVLNTADDLDPRFLRYLSETTYFQQTCFHSSIGVHVEKMLFRLDKWLKWPFNLPPIEEQRRIVELLDTATAQQAAVQRQLDLLKEEKRALMQDLLTGKRRVRLPAASEALASPA